LGKIEKIALAYRKLFDIQEDNGPVDPYETGVLIAYAFPERIAFARPGNNAQFKLANGSIAMAGHKDDLANEPWLAVAHIDARQGMGKIFMASPLNPKDLAPLVKTREVVRWDTTSGLLSASKDLRIGSIVLQSISLPPPDKKFRAEAISEAIKTEGESLLNFSEEVVQWQNRILSLRKWRPDDGWADVSTSTLLMTNSEWLLPQLTHVERPKDLKKIELLSVLKNFLSDDKQAALDNLAPKEIRISTDVQGKVHYQSDGEPPVLEVGLQQIMTLVDNPRINEGRTVVQLNLQTPDHLLLQTTCDIRSFWLEVYPELKVMLRKNFINHPWPDPEFVP